jgi:4-amino-4-deoxy-L-arabinose transferase-like glycosyltransferase
MSSHGTTSEPPTPPAPERGTPRLALPLLLLVALLAHLWLLGARWINPDEGAHLMDGVLLLDGLVPGVDFGARQPFYVLATAAVLEIFGVGFVPGRTLALMCTLAAAAILYGIARDLFDAKVALVSAGLFLFMPFSLMLSVNAKTEPLAILLAAATIWFAIRGMRGGRGAALHFAAAGALSALGFYVRESGLAILAALVFTLAWRLRRAPIDFLRAATSIATGFLAIGLLVGAVHARHSSIGDALSSASINPFVFVYRNVRQVTDGLRDRVTTDGPISSLQQPAPSDPSQEPSAGARLVRGDQSFDVTLRNIVESVRLNAVLIVGALLYPLVLITGRSRRDAHAFAAWGSAGLVLVAWAGSMCAAYLFWAVRRGFFRAYFLEISPPLTILLAAAFVYSAREFVERTGRLRMGLGLALLVAALLVVPGLLGSLSLSRPLYFVVPTTALAVVHLLEVTEYRRWLLALLGVAVLSILVYVARPLLPDVVQPGLYALLVVGVFLLVSWAAGISWTSSPRTLSSFVSYALIVSALFLTLAESLPRTDLRYDGLWGPAAVRAVANEIRDITGPEDEVLSGGVIWELQAGRRPFMNTSHPLSFRNAFSDQVASSVRRRLAERPPSVIVLDGRTEQTYMAVVPGLHSILETSYARTLTVESETRYPIEVYRLND